MSLDSDGSIASIRAYKNKKEALSQKPSDHILFTRGLNRYFSTPDYTTLLMNIKTSQTRDFYEHIHSPLNMFFDIECYADSPFFQNPQDTIAVVKERLNQVPFLNNMNSKYVILEAHSPKKVSYHVVVRIYNPSTEKHLCFTSIADCKAFYDTLNLSKITGIIDSRAYSIFDPSVYKDGLFRSIYSSKNNEIRPFVLSHLSDPIHSELETFVCYVDANEFEAIDVRSFGSSSLVEGPSLQLEPIQSPVSDLTVLDKQQVVTFVRKEYGHTPKNIREVFLDTQLNCIVIALEERFCEFVEREHKSNHQYIVIDTHSSKQKCHDSECSDKKFREIKLQNYPKPLLEIVKKTLVVDNHEMELIDKAIEECKDYIKENFNETVDQLSFDPESQVFRGNVTDTHLVGMVRGLGRCPVCRVEHVFTDSGYCAKCFGCHAVFPAASRIPITDKFRNLNNFWLTYNQIINHNTVNNNVNLTINNFNNEEDVNLEVTIDESIFHSNQLTKLVNECLDGHKVTKLGEILSLLQKDFIYSNGEWYNFTGFVWKLDKEGIEMRRQIMNISSLFFKIQKHYELVRDPRSNDALVLLKNVKSMINKLHRPGFEEEVIRGAKLFYNDEEFVGKLNSKKHLLPFKNGVYDLLNRSFRPTSKNDFVSLTVGYDYDEDIWNPEVEDFLEQILPVKAVRDYVLRKFAECLNGDIPNTHFLMFIGNGANGKSQLLNLMKATIGEFGEKVEVTLLTRKRNNANEANTEKVKLMNKRFAFLSEPEDGERINIGLLKELTGSEEIVARGLYEGSRSFVMEAKLFLACNELPEIKGEDKALWRRIRVVEFISRFVEEPKSANEYKLNLTIPSKIREDITWRQTLIKILLDYYYRDRITEPPEIQLKTNEYREENDFNLEFVSAYLQPSEQSAVRWTDLWDVYQSWYRQIYGSAFPNKKQVKKYFENCVFKKKETSLRSCNGRGWSGWGLSELEEID